VINYLQRGFTFARLFLAFFLALIGWYVLIHTAQYLPPGAQRALSWVPGADIPEYVRTDATGTIEWRLELWEEGLKTLPQYWLVGKGYAFSEKEAIGVTGANQATDQIAWALVTSSYHNGPISLLLGLGVFGFLIGISLMIGVCARHARALRESWHHASLRQCHQAVYALLLVHTLVFFTIYGDVQASFPPFFFNFALLEALRQNDRNHPSQKEVVGEAQPMKRPRRRVRK
jgi:O-antigen ligase